jgi:hypothetical protein
MPKLSDFEKEAKKGAENPLKRLERVIRFASGPPELYRIH